MYEKEPDYDRLCESIQHSRLCHRQHRVEHYNIAKKLAGFRYSESADESRTYLNMAMMYVNIIGRSLISNNPRVLLTEYDRSDRPSVSSCESWVNDEVERLDMATTLKRIVLDGMISMGVGLVSVATPAETLRVPGRLQPGEPYFTNVNLDDFVYDVNVSDIREASYVGHRYRAVKEAVVESDLYDKEVRDHLAASDWERYNAEGDPRIGTLGRMNYRQDGEFEDMVDLWDVYLPRYGLICTLLDESVMGASVFRGKGGKSKPLRVSEWIGHDSGPYECLMFGRVPGNPFPKGPLQDVIDLHDFANELYRKLYRQSANFKQVTLVPKGNAEDTARFQKSRDGDIVPVDDPKSFQVVMSRGPNQEIWLMMKEVFDRFSMMSGNLITIGGLAPQAQTATQENLLSQQSSAQVSEMQEVVTKFTSRVFEKMLWYWWKNPYKVMQTKYSVEGLPEASITRELYPWTEPNPRKMRRIGPIPKMKIDPYSMRYSSPSQKADQMVQLVRDIYMPLHELAAQSGNVLDVNEFFRIQSRYRDIPELRGILSIQEPPENEDVTSEGGGEETTRNYVRQSVGQDSYAAQQEEQAALLESVAGQNGQMNGQMNGQGA